MDSTSPIERSIRTIPAVPGYELLREIGRGGYGVVYLSRQLNSGHYVAVKVIYRDLFGDEQPYLRELNGVRNFKTLKSDSPFLLKVLDLFESPDRLYFCCILELADDANGATTINPAEYRPRTLKHDIEKSGRRQRLPAAQCIELGIALAKGLQTLHNNGLIHRDVKPSNIVFVRGVPKIADVGLVTDHEATLTKYTPHAYAAPEAEHATRADIYGFGKVLYEICTGLSVDRFPSLPTTFKDWDDHVVCLQLNRVIATACAVELRDRYASFGDLLEDLESVRDGREIRRQPRVVRSFGIAAVIVAVGCAVIWTAQRNSSLKVDQNGSSQMSQPQPENSKVPSIISLVQVPLAEGRLRIPDTNEVAKAKQTVMAAHPIPSLAATFPERQAFLSSLLEGVRQVHSPVEIYAQLQWAKELAIADADHGAGLKACDELSRRFLFDAQQVNGLKAGVLVGAARAATDPWQCTGVGKASTRLGFKFLAMDDYANARLALRTALSCVGRADNPFIATNAAFLENELAVSEPWFGAISRYLRILESRPNDSVAVTECGKYLCFAKNAWPQGLALLVKGNGALADVARRDLAETSFTNAQSVGDLWLALAGQATGVDRSYYSQRAAYWYAVALTNPFGEAENNALQKKREEVLQQYPPAKAVLQMSVKSTGDAKFVITTQGITLTSAQGIEDIHVNFYRWGSFKAGGPDFYPNSGETRYLPAHVDFTRVKLAQQHVAHPGQRILKFSPFADRLEIELRPNATDPISFEWEVTF